MILRVIEISISLVSLVAWLFLNFAVETPVGLKIWEEEITLEYLYEKTRDGLVPVAIGDFLETDKLFRFTSIDSILNGDELSKGSLVVTGNHIVLNAKALIDLNDELVPEWYDNIPEKFKEVKR